MKITNTLEETATKPAKTCEQEWKEAALAQSRLNPARQKQRQRSSQSFIQMDTSKLKGSMSTEVNNIVSDSAQASSVKIYASNDASAFMNNSPSLKWENRQDHHKTHLQLPNKNWRQ